MSIDRKILAQQRNELDEHHIYARLAQSAQQDNREVLQRLARLEREHYERWKRITGRELAPRPWRVAAYVAMARAFGLAFALHLMERLEDKAEDFYERVRDRYPEEGRVKRGEERRELDLICRLNDRKLLYAGAVVLGLNDALVELTGTLAGVSFAFEKSLFVGVIGLIMGVAASLSMGASSYLESRENQERRRHPLLAAAYTCIAYLLATLLLVSPYFLAANPFVALAVMIGVALCIIVLYSFYVSVAKRQSFWRRTAELACVSLGVAAVSFAFGYLLRHGLGISQV